MLRIPPTSTLRWHGVGLTTSAVTFCSLQVLVLLIVVSVLDLRILHQTTTEMSKSIMDLDANMELTQIRESIRHTKSRLRQELLKVSFCSEKLADDLRAGKVGDLTSDKDSLVRASKGGLLTDNPQNLEEKISGGAGAWEEEFTPSSQAWLEFQKLSRSAHSCAVYFDCVEVFFATRENELVAVLTDTPADGDPPPKYVFSTNLLVPYVKNATRSTEVLWLEVDEEGSPLYDSLQLGFEGFFSARLRPWYQDARTAGLPLWVEPYVGAFGSMEINSCVQIYDSTDLPKIDTLSGDQEAWQESLRAVACCGRTLAGLSETLAALELGTEFVGFVVEVAGPNTGKLISAARGKKTLPVAFTDNEERLGALGYATAWDPHLAIVASLVTARYEDSWETIEEGEILIPSDELRNAGYATEASLLVTAMILDGSIPNWKVSADGKYSSEEYQLKNMRWAGIVAVEVYRDAELRTYDSWQGFQGRATREISITIPLIILASMALAAIASLPLKRNLKTLQAAVERVQKLDFQVRDNRIRGNETYEIQRCWVVLQQMRDQIQVLCCHVPRSVLKLESSIAGSELSAGELKLRKEVGTIFVARMANLAELSSLLPPETIVKVHDKIMQIFEICVAKFGNPYADYTRDEVIIFWVNEFDADHEIKACDMAMTFLQQVDSLTRQWLRDGTTRQEQVEVRVGIHTGPILYGSYGAEMEQGSRLKFGAVGESLELASRLAGLTRTYNMAALVSCSTAERAPHCVADQPLGKLTMGGVSIPCFALLEQDASKGAAVSERDARPMSWPIVQDLHSAETNEVAVLQGQEAQTHLSRFWRLVSRNSVQLALLCLFELVIAAAILSSVTFPIFVDASYHINKTSHDLARNLSRSRSSHQLEIASESIIRSISEMPKCAELVARDIRGEQIMLNVTSSVARTLFSQALYFDAQYVSVRSCQGEYFRTSRIQDDDTFGFVLQSNVPLGAAGTGAPLSSMISYDTNDVGEPIPATNRQHEDLFRLEEETWYMDMVNEGGPSWLPLQVDHSNDLNLNLQACTTTRAKSLVAGSEAETMLHSVQTVSCCGRPLETLRNLLADLDIGVGVSFIVEAEGPTPGMVVAAASAGRALPAITMGTRYSALEYPEDIEPALGFIARGVMRDKSLWTEVEPGFAEVRFNQDGDETSSLAAYTTVLDGGVPDWRIENNGTWSFGHYRPRGLKWVLVVAVSFDAFLNAEESNSLVENDKVFQRSRWNRLLLFPTAVLLSAVVGIICGRAANREFRGVLGLFERFQRLDFTQQPLVLSNVRELRNLMISFETMRLHLDVLKKYVSPEIINRIQRESQKMRRTAKTHLWAQQMTTARLGMRSMQCTIMAIGISNFAQVSETLSRVQLIKLLGGFVRICSEVIQNFQGVLVEFSNERIVCFWRISDGDESTAVMATMAAEKIIQEMRKLNSSHDYSPNQVNNTHEDSSFGQNYAAAVQVKARIGITSGMCMVGNLGTKDRLKYSIVGESVDQAVQYLKIAKTMQRKILMDENVREGVLGTYICQYVWTSPVGCLYTIKSRSRTFEQEMQKIEGHMLLHRTQDEGAHSRGTSVVGSARPASVHGDESIYSLPRNKMQQIASLYENFARKKSAVASSVDRSGRSLDTDAAINSYDNSESAHRRSSWSFVLKPSSPVSIKGHRSGTPSSHHRESLGSEYSQAIHSPSSRYSGNPIHTAQIQKFPQVEETSLDGPMSFEKYLPSRPRYGRNGSTPPVRNRTSSPTRNGGMSPPPRAPSHNPNRGASLHFMSSPVAGVEASNPVILSTSPTIRV